MIDSQQAAQAGSDLYSLLGASGGSAGVVGLIFFLIGKRQNEDVRIAREKADSCATSLAALWKKQDAIREEVYAGRLSDSKEYATKGDVKEAIREIQAHMDQRFDDISKRLGEKR